MAKTKLYTIYMGLYRGPTKHMFKMAPVAVTWRPSSNLWHTKSQRSEQVYHTAYQGRLTTISRLVEFVHRL